MPVDAPPNPLCPVGLNYWGGMLYDTFMEQSRDQAGASYGMIAEAFRKADDYSWAVYRINPKAVWHDGKPITPEDIIWSMETLRTIYPLWKEYFKNVNSIEQTGELEVTFKFDQTGNRELPHIIGDLVVLPKHWWEGIDENGNKRDITKPTTEPPIGSGPFKIGKFDLGKFITYERVKDYWAQDIPVRKGRYNVDKITYTYFLNQNAMWEAFKKGNISDYRAESKEQRWVQEYDFPAVRAGNVEKLTCFLVSINVLTVFSKAMNWTHLAYHRVANSKSSNNIATNYRQPYLKNPSSCLTTANRVQNGKFSARPLSSFNKPG